MIARVALSVFGLALFACGGSPQGFEGTWHMVRAQCGGRTAAYTDFDLTLEVSKTDARIVTKVPGCTSTFQGFTPYATATSLEFLAGPTTMRLCSPTPTCSGAYTIATGGVTAATTFTCQNEMGADVLFSASVPGTLDLVSGACSMSFER